MKKIFSLFLVICCLFAFSACDLLLTLLDSSITDGTQKRSGPTNLKVTTEFKNDMHVFYLSWDSVLDATYNIYYNSENTPNTNYRMTGFPSNTTTFPLDSTYYGARLYFFVTSVVAGSESNYSNSFCVVATNGKVQDLQVMESSSSSISLSWKKQYYVDGNYAKSATYEVRYKKTSDSVYSTIDNISTNSYTINSLDELTEYEFQVRVKLNSIYYDYSDTIKETTLEKTNVHIEPINSNTSSTSVSLDVSKGQSIYLTTINNSDAFAQRTNLRYVNSSISSVRSANEVDILSRTAIETGIPEETLLEAKRLQEEGKRISGIYSNGVIRIEKELSEPEPNASMSRSLSSSDNYSLNNKKEIYCDGNTYQVVMKAEGKYCWVWINNANYSQYSYSDTDNKLNDAQLKKIAETFDKLYAYETNVFGSKYSSSKYKSGYIYPSNKISIFLYDIEEDYKSNQQSGTVGYFTNYDFYSGNETECFYLDVHFTDKYQDIALSTLAHEFQHMLRYVNKGLNAGTLQSEDVWLNEMCSQVCEDMVQSLLGVSDSDSPKERLYTLCKEYYFDSITDWTQKQIDYATAYAFGAWLIRNYGGVNLLNRIALNDGLGIDCIMEAVKYVNPTYTGNFSTLIKDYAIAMTLNLSENDAKEQNYTTLNKEDTRTLNGQTYTFAPININNYVTQTSYTKSYAGLKKLPSDSSATSYAYWGTNYNIEPNSFVIQSIGVANTTGKINITFAGTPSENLLYYIVVK